jgi:hypothetical protein
VEKKISKTDVIAEKAIEFREFDINEGFVRGKVLFIDGSVLEFPEYLKDDIRLKYRFHYMNEKGALIFRYDNAPHYQISTFPDHKHTSEDVIASSPQELSGVVDEIERIISSRGWA